MKKLKLAKKPIYIITILIILPLFLVISLSSLVNLYEKRSAILFKLGYKGGHHNEKRFLINPLKQSAFLFWSSLAQHLLERWFAGSARTGADCIGWSMSRGDWRSYIWSGLSEPTSPKRLSTERYWLGSSDGG